MGKLEANREIGGRPVMHSTSERIAEARRAASARTAGSRGSANTKRRSHMLTGWRDFDEALRTIDLLHQHIDHVFDDPPAVPARYRGWARATWPAGHRPLSEEH